LSENAKFSLKCQQQGVKFIGPGAFAIESMGSKKESKILMTKGLTKKIS
jgi:3-methylcrotonyl-CoA carboxylase alpha subunit